MSSNELKFCAVCGLFQIETPSGLNCPNGHGGAPSVSSLETVETHERFLLEAKSALSPCEVEPLREYLFTGTPPAIPTAPGALAGLAAGEVIVSELFALTVFAERVPYVLAVIDHYMRDASTDDRAILTSLRSIIQGLPRG